MDQSTLVATGHALLEKLDALGIAPRAAVWVHATDTDQWRFWIVPAKQMTDKHAFYRHIAEIITSNLAIFPSLNTADIEMKRAEDRAIKALATMFKVRGRSSVELRNNMLNGVYIPDGVILRMDL